MNDLVRFEAAAGFKDSIAFDLESALSVRERFPDRTQMLVQRLLDGDIKVINRLMAEPRSHESFKVQEGFLGTVSLQDAQLLRRAAFLALLAELQFVCV